MTRLHFPADRILNSPVIDTATEEVMYEVKSKAITGSRDIRLTTAIHDVKKNEVVAVWERTRSIERGEDWITYHSATSDGILSDWLPQLGQFSPKEQLFIAPNTEQYTWRRDQKTFKLMQGQTVLARSKHTSGLTFKPRVRPGLSLDVEPQLEGVLDAVILAFVILEQLRWEESVTVVHTSDVDGVFSWFSSAFNKRTPKPDSTENGTVAAA